MTNPARIEGTLQRAARWLAARDRGWYLLSWLGFAILLGLIARFGMDAGVSYDENAQRTYGDLILAWGTPSGFAQYGRDIDVYWGTQSAHLTTCSFRPESRVEFIIYAPVQPVSVSPWHGFRWHDSKGNKQAQICNSQLKAGYR